MPVLNSQTKVSRKFFWYLFLLVLVVSAFYFYSEYNRKPASTQNLSPDFIVPALNLANEFETDETAANKKYLGKLIQVTGTLFSIDNNKETLISITVGDDLHKIACLLDIKHAAIIRQYKVLSSITVKGICTGYLMDVELNRCVIVQ